MQFVPRFLLALAALSLAASPSAFADPVINGGFETGDFSGWTQGGNYNTGSSYTAVVTDSPANGYYVYAGTYAAALGPNGTPGTLSQTFADTVGTVYNLSFALHGDANDGSTSNYFDASVGSASLNLANVLGGYQLYSLTFLGTGSDTLSFSFLDNDNYLSLDAVGIASSPAATPEPSSLILLGTGSLVVSWMSRRKPKTS